VAREKGPEAGKWGDEKKDARSGEKSGNAPEEVFSMGPDLKNQGKENHRRESRRISKSR